MDTANEIWFYDTKTKPYGIFSNFYVCENFKYNNKEYFHSEGYFQAEKFQGFLSNSADRRYSKLIAYQNTAGKSAVLARQKPSNLNYKWAQDLKVIIDKSIENGVCIRPDWENIKDNIMRRAVFIKFSASELFRTILIDTGDKLLFEHTHGDLFEYRKNKGSKCPKMPQTKSQFDQVKRILKDGKYYIHFEK